MLPTSDLPEPSRAPPATKCSTRTSSSSTAISTRSPRSRTTIERSTDSRRARNSASDRIGTRRRPASRPSRRRWRLASSRVEPRTLCTPSPSSSRCSRGGRTFVTVTVPGGSVSSPTSAVSSPLPRRRRLRRRRRVVPASSSAEAASSDSSSSAVSSPFSASVPGAPDSVSSSAPASPVSSVVSSSAPSVPRPRPRPRRPRRRRLRPASVSSPSSAPAGSASVAPSDATSAGFSSTRSARPAAGGREGAWNKGVGGANSGASGAPGSAACSPVPSTVLSRPVLSCGVASSVPTSGSAGSGSSEAATCSATFFSTLDWALRTSTPSEASAASTSRLVRASLLASACTRILSGRSSSAGTVTGPPDPPAGDSVFDIQLLRPRAPPVGGGRAGATCSSLAALRDEQSSGLAPPGRAVLLGGEPGPGALDQAPVPPVPIRCFGLGW